MRPFYTKLKIATLTATLLVLSSALRAQCPHVFDFYGQVVDNPYWYSCSGNDFSFNLTSPNTWGDYTIDWGDGSPQTSGTSWSPPTFINHVYAAAVDTFVVTITEINTGCIVTGTVVMEEASSASIQIPVGGLTQACAPQMMEFINSSTNVSETTIFTWDFGDGSPILTFDYTNWNQTIQHTYEVGTVTCETEVTLTAENYCNTVQGGNSTATFNPIRIWDLDDPSITPSATLLCYPDTIVTFTNTTYRNCLFQGNIYQRYEWWNFGDYWNLGHDSIIDWTPWPPTFPHTMHYPGIGTYTVELLDSNFCGIAPTSVTIQIVPPPTAGISASADSVCVGESITFYQQASGGANFYKWKFGTGPWIATGSGNVTHVFNTPGTFQVGSMVGISGATDGCTDTVWVDVVVLPAPDVVISASQYDGCDAFTVDFDGFASDATTWQWQFDVPPFNHSGEIPPLIDYNTPGDHPVTLNVIGFNGCAASTTDMIHVYQSPVVNFTVENLCEGDTAQFFDLSLASPNDSIIGWEWNFDDGNTSSDQNPTNYFTTPGTYDISLYVNSVHCFASDTIAMTIEDAPQAIISLDVATGCSPITVQFGNNTVNADSQVWDFGDGTTSNEYIPLHVFSNPGNTDTTFMVVMTAMNTFGCGTSDTLYVSPLPSAQAAFLDNSNPPGCSPFAAEFYNNSLFADSYLWDLGNGVTSNLFEPTYTYVNTTGSLSSYMVTLIAYNDNGCNDTTQHPIIVYPLADFDFTLDVGTAGCSPVVATMPFVSGVQVYAWDFGDGQTSGLATPTHSFVNQTGNTETYSITLIGTSAFGCIDTAVTDITVLPSPVVQFTLNGVSGCSPLNTEIQNISIGADNFDWAYGDGTFSTTADSIHYHSFSNTNSGVANFTITLTASNNEGCSDNFTQSVEVFPQIEASFTDPGEHCSPATISFVNSSINASGYQWDFGNSFQSIMANPTTNYTNPSDTVQVYDVTMIATSSFGCTDTAYAPVIINPNPVAAFSLDALSGCHPLVVNFTNNSFNVDQFAWDFGNGQTSQTSDATFQHTFENFSSVPVTYTITLNVSTIEGCYDEVTQSVTVYPQPIAGFVDPGVFCSPATVNFINTSFNANSYFWDFGNGTNSSQSNPSQLFVNSSDTIQNLNVQLIAISSYGCSDTASHSLVINNKPVAAFNVDVVSGCDPLVVNIVNNSLYGDTYNWSFGDGSTSASADSVLQHTFINSTNGPVYYTIALTLSTDEGCFDQYTQQIEVFPHAEASFMDPGTHCAPVNVSFINTSDNAQTYNWDFGNGTNSTIEEPAAYFTNLSDTTLTLNVTLQITSPFGCIDSYSAPLVLNPVPQADFYLSTSAACEPGPVTITNTSTNAATYNWNYGDGTISNNGDTEHTHDFVQLLNGAAQYEIGLVAVTEFGCIDTASAIYSIYPDIVAAFTVDTIDCSPFNAAFTNQSVGAVSYQWSFGDGGFSSQTHPVYQYTTDNVNDVQYTAQLIATSIYGCSDTATQVMQIMHTPAAIALMDSVYGCYPTNVELQNQSIGADSYLWVYGNGITSTTDAQEHTYGFVNVTNEVVTYDITLHAYTDYGCFSSDNLSIDVAPPIEADFYVEAEGCTPVTATFDNLSDGGFSYSWNFGDGDMSNDYEPTHTFFNWGETDTTYLVTFVLEDTFGCTDTAYSYVSVYAEPNAAFTATPSQQTWPDATITLDNLSSGGTLNSSWDMDDGTDLYENEPGTYTYSTWGEYQIRLIVSNGGCSDTTFQTIEIIPPMPVANFQGPAEGCVPLTVQFENLSEYAVASEWNFGDGGEANATNPVYTYWIPGTYSVTLTVTGPGGQTDQMTQEQIIHVYPRAHAAFTVVPNEVNVPGEPVYCLNQSQNATSYYWEFGDGGTSVTENPIYYYQAEGEYDILLVANNQYDCPDTLLLESVVLATASGFIAFPNAFTPDPSSSNGGYYDPMSYDNNIFFPMHSGVLEYRLQIFNKWGELLYESNDVNRGWDGYYAGQICLQDVYAWKATALFVDGQSVVQSGDVTLIRH